MTLRKQARLPAKGNDELSDLARRTNDMLDMLERRLQFQEAVGRISSDLARTDIAATDAAIGRALDAMGTFAGADRAHVVLFRAGTLECDRVYEWCAQDGASDAAGMQGVRMDEAMPWFAQQMSKHEFIHVVDVDSLPPEADKERERWRSQGIQSLLATPMFRVTAMVGVIGFATSGRTRAWSTDDQAMLRFAGEAVMHALARVEADTVIRREGEFREAVIDSAYEGICAYHWIPAHPFLQFNVWNRAMVEMTGYTIDEINEIGWYQAVYPDPDTQARAVARMKRMREGDDMANEEWEVTRKDGQRRQVVISTKMLYQSGMGATVLSLMTDISQQRAAEARQQRIQGDLQQVQKMESVGRLASKVAHDFNNMLGVILGRVELASFEEDVPAPVSDHLKEIQAVTLRAADMTKQLMSFSRRQAPASVVLDLNKAVTDMLPMLRQATDELVDIEWTPATGLWPVKADPSQIQQMLVNLAVNAREAVVGIGTLVVTTANIALDKARLADQPGAEPGDYVKLTVTDDGHGIEPSVLERIFEPFFTTKKVGQGAGLGLSTVYGIVRQNGGFITVSSEPGRGTTFTICFPRCACAST